MGKHFLDLRKYLLGFVEYNLGMNKNAVIPSPVNGYLIFEVE